MSEEQLKSLLIPVAAMLLTGCSTSAVVCQQWRNKQITDEKALAILGVRLQPKKQTAKDGVTIEYSDGTKTKTDFTVTTSDGANVYFYCDLIKHGLLDSSTVWTWGK